MLMGGKHRVTIEESTVLAEGMRLHYCRAGQGPALVLLHGLVGSSKNWDQNISFLARRRTVFALDLANMGASERVPGLDPSLEASADRVAQCMNALGIPRADIAGHSHGGAIAMMLAARHPRRVRRLVLFAPANPFCDLGKPLIRFYQTRIGMAFAYLVPRLPRALHKTALSRMYGDPKRVHDGALEGYTDGMNRGTVDHILGIVRSWSDDMAALREALTGLAGLPTLLIWGDRDRAVGLSSGQLLAEQLGARLMVIPGAGHLPFAESPELCNRAVTKWLR
jgi:pimeloyl-ACP methyl ester carboxylesterase